MPRRATTTNSTDDSRDRAGYVFLVALLLVFEAAVYLLLCGAFEQQ
jgi:hypothetical protein